MGEVGAFWVEKEESEHSGLEKVALLVLCWCRHGCWMGCGRPGLKQVLGHLESCFSRHKV